MLQKHCRYSLARNDVVDLKIEAFRSESLFSFIELVCFAFASLSETFN